MEKPEWILHDQDQVQDQVQVRIRFRFRFRIRFRVRIRLRIRFRFNWRRGEEYKVRVDTNPFLRQLQSKPKSIYPNHLHCQIYIPSQFSICTHLSTRLNRVDQLNYVCTVQLLPLFIKSGPCWHKLWYFKLQLINFI